MIGALIVSFTVRIRAPIHLAMSPTDLDARYLGEAKENADDEEPERVIRHFVGQSLAVQDVNGGRDDEAEDEGQNEDGR